jgi:glycosyltransferase involved in cell wall biosynthesis
LLPEVAVIIPCYNSGEYLREAVESVRAQDISVELVIVDDGSNDPGTLSALDELRAGRTRVIRQENQGVTAARNSGIKLTSSEYVVCLDADDLLLPAYCSTCLGALKGRPEVGFVYTTSQVFGLKNKLWSKESYSGLSLLIDNYIPNSAMFRRALWERTGGFSNEMKNGYEDWDFWLGAIEQGWKGYHVDQPLFRYRKHGTSRNKAANQQRGALKRLIRARHPALYSWRRIMFLMIEEKFPLPRVISRLVREEILRKIYWSIKK